MRCARRTLVLHSWASMNPFDGNRDSNAPRSQPASGYDASPSAWSDNLQLGVVDALSASVALLDSEGAVVHVNESWRRFGKVNGLSSPESGVGASYLAVCDRAAREKSEGASEAAAGIRAVLGGEVGEFRLDYPCHSPTAQRWFRLLVTPHAGEKGTGVVVMHVDISEKVQAERALAQTLELLERSAEMAKVGGWELDLATTQVRWSTETARIHEVAPGLDAPYLEAGHQWYGPESWPIIEAAVRAAVDHGTPYDLESPFITATGRHIWVRVQGFPVVEAGKTVALRGTMQDITERKQAETERRRAEEQLLASLRESAELRTALDEHAIVAATDARGRITSVNEKFCAISGYSRAELLGQDHRILNSGHHSKEFFLDLWTTIKAGQVWHGELRNRAKDGSFYWVDTTIVPFLTDDGRVRQYVAIRKDVTARKHGEELLADSEARFRQLAEHVQDVFWVREAATQRILYVSPAYETIWGRTCAQAYRDGLCWPDAIHPEDAPRLLRAAEAREPHAPYAETYRIQRPDGAVRWIRDQAFPVRGPTGEVQRFVGTAEDVTERMDLEAQLRQAQKLQALGTFSAGIAHGFNNILAAITANAELVLDDTPPEHPARASMTDIAIAAERGKVLVQEIVAFTTPRTTELRVLALAPLVDEVARLLRGTVPASVQLVTSMDPGAPPVLANAIDIHRVLLNLCTNAWHALDDQPGRIEVELQSATLDAAAGELLGLQAGRFSRLSVSDSGKGIDARIIDRIFDPFFTTKGPGRGSGLGLSVVHGIVTALDGAIRAESPPGQGTTIRVYLPAVVVAASAVARGGKGQRILLVDDDEALRSVTTRLLQRLGHRVTSFGRPADALKALQETPKQFALAITDMNMPGMDGISLAVELLKARPDLPIVLNSGSVDLALRRAAGDIGARILQKPFTMAELREAVGRVDAEDPT